MSYWVSYQHGREWELTQLIWQALVMLLTSPPPPPPQPLISSPHGEWAHSVQLVRQSHPFLLHAFHFLSVFSPSALSVWLFVSLSLFLSVSLFKALLYSFHSLSIALEANSQSQWAWVTRDKYNIAYNACKLHTHRCMFTMHVCWSKHTFKHL